MKYALYCHTCKRFLVPTNANKQFIESAEKAHKEFHEGHMTEVAILTKDEKPDVGERIVVCHLCGRPVWGNYGDPHLPNPLDLKNHLEYGHRVQNTWALSKMLKEFGDFPFVILKKVDFEAEKAAERAQSPAAQRKSAAEYTEHERAVIEEEEVEKIRRELAEPDD